MEIKEFKLYNCMSKHKEIFTPKEPGKVGIYVGGVAAYDLSLIGHARAYVAVDVLYRYMRHLGYEVTYARKFTDIDDKIIKRAKEVGKEPLDLSKRLYNEYLSDMRDLNVLVPTEQPRVSENMEEIKYMIAEIIQNGYAFSADGDVYLSVDKYPAYSRLSGGQPEDNLAGGSEGVQDNLTLTKRSQNDFALWKAAKPGEISWDSPWGPGRPGWHIECSAMNNCYLTSSFDIYGGGMDLIFPHYENELAQNCAACEIKYWMHNGFYKNNEKMSNSLGNFSTIREITNLYHPLPLRYIMLFTHYRSPVNYSKEQLEIASEFIFYLYKTLLDCKEALFLFGEKNPIVPKCIQLTPATQKCIDKLKNDFYAKLSDDLQTQDFLRGPALRETLRLMNQLAKAEPQQHLFFLSLAELEKEVKMVLDTLGLMSSSSYSEVLGQLKNMALMRAKLTEVDVLQQIEHRAQARDNKEFAKSDQITQNLTFKGIAILDLDCETIWRPCARRLETGETAV